MGPEVPAASGKTASTETTGNEVIIEAFGAQIEIDLARWLSHTPPGGTQPGSILPITGRG